jgi:hypothetical protein
VDDCSFCQKIRFPVLFPIRMCLPAAARESSRHPNPDRDAANDCITHTHANSFSLADQRAIYAGGFFSRKL